MLLFKLNYILFLLAMGLEKKPFRFYSTKFIYDFFKVRKRLFLKII